MKSLLTSLAVVFALPAAATLPATLTSDWTGSQIIPDNSASGVAFPFSISAPGLTHITGVSVNLRLTGGWNGDLYAYLSHGSGFSVLLNRVGRSALNPDGFGASGFNIQLADAYTTDIHDFSGVDVTGNFAPDGRNTSPFTVLDSSPRNALLGNFSGVDPNGSWTLFFADIAPVSVATIQSWTVTVEAVPEPTGGIILTLGLTSLFLRRTREGHR